MLPSLRVTSPLPQSSSCSPLAGQVGGLSFCRGCVASLQASSRIMVTAEPVSTNILVARCSINPSNIHDCSFCGHAAQRQAAVGVLSASLDFATGSITSEMSLHATVPACWASCRTSPTPWSPFSRLRACLNASYFLSKSLYLARQLFQPCTTAGFLGSTECVGSCTIIGKCFFILFHETAAR